jgi:RHS repeat-associated protein
MLVPNRHGSSDAYRYGFQGQEKDDEIKGEGNSLNYTFRMHDPRVGRFFAVDPLTSKYPYMTPFQFSSNSPIASRELEGLEGEDYRFNMWMTSQGGVQAQAVQAEKDIKMKITNGVFVEMPEASIDGLTFLFTSLFQSIIGGSSFGYGDMLYDDGYKTRVDIPNYGFSWSKGFTMESTHSSTGNVSFEDGMRLIDGVGTLFGIGELSTLKLKNVIKVDLMGGRFGTKGYINFDIQSLDGIADDVANFGMHFERNSVDEMLVENPMAPFMKEVENSIKPGGKMTIKGQFKNQNFSEIWDGATPEGFREISRTRGLSSEGMVKNDGSPLTGNVNEIVLEKIDK